MPRNGSGTAYRIPGTAYTNGTTNDGSELDAEQTDIYSLLTNSVASDGQTPMTGPLRLPLGTNAAPALTFSAETGTGLYRSAAGEASISITGLQRVAINQYGVLVTPGAAANPSISFIGDATTGLYRSAASEVSVSLAGTQRHVFSATGLTLPAAPTTNLHAATKLYVDSVMPPGTFVGLSGTSAGGVKTATWGAQALFAASSLSGAAYKGTSLSLSFNGATTGANGMDTGATPNSADLYIYAIFNPTTVTWATLGTTAGSGARLYGGANFPSGYTASCLIWSGKTNGSGQFTAFTQYERSIYLADTSILTTNSNVSWTGLSVSAMVPANAKTISGQLATSGGTATASVSLAQSASGTGMVSFSNSSSTATGGAPYSGLYLLSAQTVYYQTTNGGGTTTYSASINSYTI